MKLSTKIILPIILISALLILLAGCFGTPDDSPGYTPGTITGIIAAPCCSTSAEPVSETCCIAPEYWCFYCQETWSLQDGVEVILTYGEDEIATTTTNENGEFTFTDVSPGKNYVITALCPDYTDDRPLVKDVALELIEGGSFDTKITDLVSTSLGLVVDFLIDFTILGPEDIVLDEVIADKPDFPNFPKFKDLIYEVRRVGEKCGDLTADDDVQYALCLAAEEISKLTIGCGPGYTPPPPSPCAGNIAPSISSVLLDGTAVSIGETVHVVVGTQYVITVNASDDGIKDPLTYSATIDGIPVGTVVSNVVTVTPPVAGTFEVYVHVKDGCLTTTWGPVTVVVDPIDYTLTIDYEYEDTTTAAASHVETLNVGDPYSVASPVIAGYTASQLIVSGTMPADDVTVLVVYTAIDYTLTIDYEYEDTTTAAASHVETLNVGDPYSVASPVIAGYTASQLIVSGTMPADDVTVLVVYTAIDYTLTIDYEYEDTTTAAASHVETLNVGDPYSVASPVIAGYTASQLIVSGTMPADDVTVLVVYTAIDYTLTIDYEYEDTTTAAASHVETLNVGDPYSVASPVIAGYTASQLIVSGTMPADDVTVLVVYTAIDYTLTVLISPLAAETDGCAVDRSAVGPYNYGDVVTLTSNAAAGWTFSHWTGDLTGSVDPDDVTIDGDKTVTAVFTQIIVIEQGDLHANLASGDGTNIWDLHVWSWIRNNSNQPFNGYMRIRSKQGAGGITKYYPSETGYVAITVEPGKDKYPKIDDYWIMSEVATGSGKPKDVVVDIWIYDASNIEIAHSSEYAN